VEVWGWLGLQRDGGYMWMMLTRIKINIDVSGGEGCGAWKENGMVVFGVWWCDIYISISITVLGCFEI
jgi:hypothetical protein